MERETGFEPATSTLARSHSTTELFPLGKRRSSRVRLHRLLQKCLSYHGLREAIKATSHDWILKCRLMKKLTSDTAAALKVTHRASSA
jgi:hypothetical protein